MEDEGDETPNHHRRKDIGRRNAGDEETEEDEKESWSWEK